MGIILPKSKQPFSYTLLWHVGEVIRHHLSFDLYKSLMDMSQKLNTTLDELSPTIKKVGQKSNSLVFSSDSKDVEIKVKKWLKTLN